MEKKDIISEFDLAIEGTLMRLWEIDKEHEEHDNLVRLQDRLLLSKIMFDQMYDDAKDRKEAKCKMELLDPNF